MNLFADISACGSLLLCSLCDLKARRIPNFILIIIIAVSSLAFGTDFLLRLLPLMIGAAFIYYATNYLMYRLKLMTGSIDTVAGNKTWLLKYKNLGGGDLKIMSLVIAWYELSGLVMIAVGLAAAAVSGLVMIARKKMTIRDKLPLAPYMLLGFVIYKLAL